MPSEAPSASRQRFDRFRTALTADSQRVLPLLGWHLLVMAVLRAVWLARPDPFGQPLVGKFDWYWFHAVAYDVQQATELARPVGWLLVVAAVVGQAGVRRWAVGLSAGLVMLATALAVPLAQVDLEVMRFVGSHLSWTLASTYVGPALWSELPRLLSHDAGGPYVGVALLFMAPLAQGWLQWRAWRRPASEHRWPWRLGGLALGTLAAWLLTEVIWPGHTRTWRLRPIVSIVREELAFTRPPPLPAEQRQRAAGEHEARWRAGHPGQTTTFADPSRPLWHLSPWRACQQSPEGAGCADDRDHDGAPQRSDCDDARPDVHPGAAEVPGDGVDQDCSGADAQPWNILLLVLESHRAVSVGHVFGGKTSSPELDRLASQGYAQGRAVAASLPTIGSFMAIHTGVLACAECQVATQFATARLPGLPATLREHGYYTRFFSAFDPAWDNQNAWLRRWYDEVDYDRSREEDADLLAHVGDWLHDRWPQEARGRPFLVTATTRSNHFPFPRVAGVERTGDESWPARMHDTMRYTDAAVGRLIERLRKEPWFAHTVVVVTGDHGYPLGEHGAWYLYETLHIEATGVPLVLVGDHPKLTRLRGKLALEPASHVDLAPTVLDLAGIDESGAWMGRSLLTDAPGVALTYKEKHAAIERGRQRLLFDVDALAEPARWRLFDRTVDLREQRPLPQPEQARAMAEEAALASRWMRELYETDAVLPPPAR
jgi:arylsulfatase A-like enzyme